MLTCLHIHKQPFICLTHIFYIKILDRILSGVMRDIIIQIFVIAQQFQSSDNRNPKTISFSEASATYPLSAVNHMFLYASNFVEITGIPNSIASMITSGNPSLLKSLKQRS